MNIKKKIFIFFIILFFVFFLVFYYKNRNEGNTIINKKDIVEKFINNYQNYVAEIDVDVKSNKNLNKYKIRQEENEKYSKEEVVDGNIKGLTIEINENTLKVYNTNLNLEKVFNNYKRLSDNSLFLSTFIKEYNDEKNSVIESQDDSNFIINLKLSKESYIRNKELYIDKKTLKPVKMIISSGDKTEIISIIYNNVEVK